MFDEPVLGFVPDKLCGEPPVKLFEVPDRSLEVTLLLSELPGVMPVSSLEVEGSSAVVRSALDKALEGVADSSLIDDELGSVVKVSPEDEVAVSDNEFE